MNEVNTKIAPSSAADAETPDRRQAIFEATVRRLLHPVHDLLDDPAVTEIMINGPAEIYAERKTRETLPDGGYRDRSLVEKLAAKFEGPEHLEAAARAIAQYSGKRLTPEELSVEARLYDKSRVHIVQQPAARNGLCIAIRRFAKSEHSVANLIANGSLIPEAADFLKVCLALRKNVVVSGGTSTGKTTVLNALSEFMDATDRLIIIEDVNELEIRQPHAVYLEAQKPDRFGRGGITIRELFRASLRMRPDRIIVGECRGAEALDMIQAMTSGHSGSLTTLHADTPDDALNRLETMALMSDVDLPQRALRAQIASAVDVIVQVQRIGGRRGITFIHEVGRLSDDDNYTLKPIFDRSDAIYRTGYDGPLCAPTREIASFAEEAAPLARQKGLSHVFGIDPAPADKPT
ncbi:CpaF family protein [Rhizobium sp. L1K21]|uniref:CpaF family protein n=1 Tax=Rhizobium sp. L1K21 TaxID=2954933 RepID=UPI00209264AA|nr:ATPase, T2SS/T4P/T4SS family [Rhizobium sp. L1K21]MCO6188250.1 Flp pilus assembly complex ATPase component TadA [Rhizobium sp. L1K21]